MNTPLDHQTAEVDFDSIGVLPDQTDQIISKLRNLSLLDQTLAKEQQILSTKFESFYKI